MEELVAERGKPISEVVRQLIDDAYEDVMRERRRKAVERLVSLNAECPPDAAELSKILEEVHAPCGIY